MDTAAGKKDRGRDSDTPRHERRIDGTEDPSRWERDRSLSHEERREQRNATWRVLKSPRFLQALKLLTDAAARIIRPPVLTPKENTARCYGRLFDPLCADTGVWPDYTEGYYQTGRETYEEAQRQQIDFILERTRCGPGTRLMDIGCGNGRLLRRGAELGAEVSGITIVPSQVETCRREGLDVRLCGFRQVPERFEPGGYDIVTLNGPTEHFVNEQDVLEGRGDEVRRTLFESIRHLLRPGGRVFFTAMHFRHAEPDIHEVIRHPIEHPVGSYEFYWANLIAIYSGWYTYREAFAELAAEQGMRKVFEREGTDDYYRTSRDWKRAIVKFARNNPGFIARFAARLFREDPRYFWQVYVFFAFDVWTWQFRGGSDSPIHSRWLMFELPEGASPPA